MTWTKLSDDFSDDCWTLSDAAVRLHVEGLVWSNRKLLDCRIPVDDITRFSKAAGAADELLDCGWWSRDGDVYVIRHHAAYQRSREQTVAIQERNQRNGARGGRRPKGGREQPDTPKTHLGNEVGSEVASHLETQRDGTGQDRVSSVPAAQLASTSAAMEEPTRTRASERFGGCVECQRRSVFGSGPCPDHRVAS